METIVNGVRIHFEMVGQGAPLLMIHGNGENHTVFADAALILQNYFTVYLPDSRGHGRSEKEDHFDYGEMADDMIAFIEDLGLGRVTLYGFSDGGIIGLLVASKRPDLVKTLIVSGANTQPRAVKSSVYWRLKFENFRKKNPLLELMLTQPHITADDLGRITARTLVLAGEKDLICEWNTRFIADSIPGSRLCILKNEGHGSYIVHSEKIARIILKFTARDRK